MNDKNPWAVVRYEEGRAVDAVRNAGDNGLWSSRDLSVVYDMLAMAKDASEEGVWGVVQLHRGAETNILLEVGA